ncbi:hypothetical protein PVAG01_01675 [Phlyctema vagabunda]|uniref:Uncharacterized protein n=1 Tax=Phlyctema vagabunda TaxID=108571 RepID=A0ABR4PZ38_9HELO
MRGCRRSAVDCVAKQPISSSASSDIIEGEKLHGRANRATCPCYIGRG